MKNNDSMSEDVIWEGLKIYRTFNYDKFKLIKGNRKVRISQVNKLKTSYQEGQVPRPLITNEFLELIDGQHSLEAMRQLELPVPYMIIKGLGIKEVQRLNRGQKNWQISDHLKCYVERGKKMYIEYNERIHKKFRFDHITKISLIKGRTLTVGGTGQRQLEIFKNGDFQATEREFKHAIEVGLKIEDVARYFSEYLNHFQVRGLWNAVRKLADYHSYDHSEMMKKLENQKFRVEKLLMRFKKLNTNEFLIVLEDIYNYHKSKEAIVFRHDLKVTDPTIGNPKEISV